VLYRAPMFAAGLPTPVGRVAAESTRYSAVVVDRAAAGKHDPSVVRTTPCRDPSTPTDRHSSVRGRKTRTYEYLLFALRVCIFVHSQSVLLGYLTAEYLLPAFLSGCCIREREKSFSDTRRAAVLSCQRLLPPTLLYEVML